MESPVGNNYPLISVIADFYMERFEQTARETGGSWKIFTYLNCTHPSIYFTREREKGGQLPFLDVLVMKRCFGY